MKKKLVVLLALVLSIGTILSACSSKDSSSAEKDGKNGQPYEIKWYTIGTPQKDTDKVFAEVNKYVKKKINATVKMTQIDWGDWAQKSQVMINSGEPFDIIFTNGTDYVQNAQKGAFLPIDDMLNKEGKDLKNVIDPALLEGIKVNGKVYGVPTNKEAARQSVYTFNKRLVDKYHFDLSKVKSLEDLEPMLKVIKEKEPKITPLATFKAYLPYDYIFNNEMPFAVAFNGDRDHVVNQFESDLAMSTYKTMHSYYKAGYLKEDAATSKESWPMDVENWFVRMGDSQPYADLLWSRSAKYDVVSVPVEKPVTINDSVSGSIQAISATSKNPKKTMEFLTLLNTDPYLRNLVDKGIEGVHYKKDKAGKIEDLPARIDNYNMPTYSLGNHFILYLYKNDPKDKWEKFKDFNESATAAPTLGFHFNSDPVRSELAAITNISKEFYPALATGSVDPEVYLPKLNKKLKDAGADKVLKEIQKQFDKWKSTQK
ncbi:carbohydrate ABC transporter substrate-binding protein, CUT1 family (TC 3.A.1.1.-) [Fictibacillus solisalsi]|uniref:Carbohydrate ABC transporter substrate-binding protein, CUT1 family (TC 3.A.1.1.-) n=1 Tax=Fictibacillus solisalsi TaxID=459525 RepID=A0A1G9YGW6_9BACL|nr:ABC transporter substrate-binding protein [Fictibacillus solisalsi]SDN08182.1 carbohydrate ABC transporter substrate-binding protein, CUT1 family (TC 3.A.1.1.-) [Fictibacillus solisalsi]